MTEKLVDEQQIDWKDIQDRLLKFFEDRGALVYERIDVEKHYGYQLYHKAVCFGNFASECIQQNSDHAQCKQNDFHSATKSFYFSTMTDHGGAKSRDELPEHWVNAFIVQNSRYASLNGDSYPCMLRDLLSSNVSELCLKMAILGI